VYDTLTSLTATDRLPNVGLKLFKEDIVFWLDLLGASLVGAPTEGTRRWRCGCELHVCVSSFDSCQSKRASRPERHVLFSKGPMKELPPINSILCCQFCWESFCTRDSRFNIKSRPIGLSAPLRIQAASGKRHRMSARRGVEMTYVPEAFSRWGRIVGPPTNGQTARVFSDSSDGINRRLRVAQFMEFCQDQVIRFAKSRSRNGAGRKPTDGQCDLGRSSGYCNGPDRVCRQRPNGKGSSRRGMRGSILG